MGDDYRAMRTETHQEGRGQQREAPGRAGVPPGASEDSYRPGRSSTQGRDGGCRGRRGMPSRDRIAHLEQFE